LHAILQMERQIVAEVVEAEFVVGPVGDVAPVSGALLLLGLRVFDHADFEAEKTEHGRHPVRVALREVFIDRDHMDALAGQRVQVRRECRHQRLALTRAHFGDLAHVQRQAADQLYVEMTQAELAPRSLPHQRERLGNQGVERCTAGNACLELASLLGELIVLECLHFGLEEIGVGHPSAQLLNDALITAAEICVKSFHTRRESFKSGPENRVLYG